jgi:hypothetical protein
MKEHQKKKTHEHFVGILATWLIQLKSVGSLAGIEKSTLIT